MVGATSNLDADAEEVTSDVLTGKASTLAITVEELPSTLEDIEDVEVVDMLAGGTFNLDTDADEEASKTLLGEVTPPSIPVDILLDCPC